MKILSESYLTVTEGGSNKHYLPRIVENSPGNYEVVCLWGAIGAKPQSTLKYTGPDRVAAQNAYERVRREKLGKGYRERPIPADLRSGSVAAPGAPASASARPSTPVPALVVPKEDATGVPRFGAQLAGDRGLEALYEAVANPGLYAVEEKWDGFRALLAIAPDGSIAIRNRNGEDKGRGANTPVLFAALRALIAAMPSMTKGTVLDGELVGPSWSETAHLLGGAGRSESGLRFVVFDLPYGAGRDLRSLPFSARRAHLETLMAKARSPIEISQLLRPTRDLAAQIWARDGEGLIIKRLDAPYLSGNRNSWSKIKETHSAEAVITGFEPGNGKYAGMVGAVILSQYRDGKLVEVTRVSGMDDATRAALGPGAINVVLEFLYQKRTTDSYRHPRWLRVRPDKDPADCIW